jgi:lipid-binding SYLF domain-containing protein
MNWADYGSALNRELDRRKNPTAPFRYESVPAFAKSECQPITDRMTGDAPTVPPRGCETIQGLNSSKFYYARLPGSGVEQTFARFIYTMEVIMHKRIWHVLASAIVISLLAAVYPALAATEADRLVSKAEATFKNFQNDPQMTWLRNHLNEAKAVMIAPEVRKAGLVVGGSGGRAILLARDPATGNWSGPAFYTIANASLGFQAGIEKSEVVMLVMTDRGLNSLLNPQLKLGADASIAAGPFGAGAEKSITTDVVSFSRSKGIYGGVNLDGTAIKENRDWNNRFYGKAVTPTDILVRHSVTNYSAEKLQDEIAQAVTK